MSTMRDRLRRWWYGESKRDADLRLVAQEILSTRDAKDVADVLMDRATLRDRIEASEIRADGSEDRESEWSLHKDHPRDPRAAEPPEHD